MLEGDRDGAEPPHAQARDAAMPAVAERAVGRIDVTDEVARDVVFVPSLDHTQRRRRAIQQRVDQARAVRLRRFLPVGVPAVVAVRHHDDHLGAAAGDERVRHHVDAGQRYPVGFVPRQAMEVEGHRVAPGRRRRVRRRQVHDVMLLDAECRGEEPLHAHRAAGRGEQQGDAGQRRAGPSEHDEPPLLKADGPPSGATRELRTPTPTRRAISDYSPPASAACRRGTRGRSTP